MNVGDRVYGTYNEWVDHERDHNKPSNYFKEEAYSGKIIEVKENVYVVKTKTLGIIEVIPEEGDEIYLKDNNGTDHE